MRVDCRIDGLGELAKEIEELAENSEEVFEEMLVLGSEEIKECWKRAANKHGHKDTGEMIKAIDWSRVGGGKGALMSYIYPRGYARMTTAKGKTYARRDRNRHATKAFILHYGRKNQPASYWIDTAMHEAGEKVPEILFKRWSEFIDRRR